MPLHLDYLNTYMDLSKDSLKKWKKKISVFQWPDLVLTFWIIILSTEDFTRPGIQRYWVYENTLKDPYDEKSSHAS